MISVESTFVKLLQDKYSELSSAQRKVADYIFQNVQKSAFSTAVQISEEVGVSDTSVIRLSYSLGFESFSEMQTAIQNHVLSNSDNEAVISKDDEGYVDSSDPMLKLIGDEINSLNKLAKKINLSDIDKAAEAMIKADQVLILGYGNGYSSAYEFYLRLEMLRPNVTYYRYRVSETESQRLYRLTEESVVFAVSLPRHIRDTLTFIHQAKNQGATIIALTEYELNPYSYAADISFMIDVNYDEDTGFLSHSPAMIIIFLLLKRIFSKGGSQMKKHLENISNYMLVELDVYL